MTSARILVAIAVVQTALIAVLVFKIAATETKVEALTAALTSADAGGEVALAPGEPREKIADEEAIAALIQSEFAALRKELAPSTAEPRDVAAAPQESTQRSFQPPATQAEIVAARAAFERSLNTYVARGRIGANEMADLETQIANMPPEERARAIGVLSRAINRGGVDVHL